MSYKVRMHPAMLPADDWAYYGLRFATAEEAETYGLDLFHLFPRLETYEVHESDEPVNYAMGNDGPKRTEEVSNHGNNL
jgi:hypothetical protein